MRNGRRYKGEITMATKKADINIIPIANKWQEFTIVGTTPLIVHNWSHKAKQEILDKQRGKKVSSKHDIKIPVNDFAESLYWLTDRPELGKNDDEAEINVFGAIQDGAKFGFPVTGIKQSIISGAYRAGLDVTQVGLKGQMFLAGATESSTVELAEIEGDAPEMRQDMVRVGGMSKSADVRFRAEFKNWRIRLAMKYDKNGKWSLEQILNMINYGGMYTGIGEWRPEKNGQYGMYELLTD